ncbi:MAG: hypothetical protein Q7S81_01170 [bacterium]|nr:hypothetical protein [bacterium]
MIGKAIRNFIFGVLAAMLGVVIIVAMFILFRLGNTTFLYPGIAMSLIAIGFILMGSFFMIVNEHLELVSRVFLKHMPSRRERLDAISYAIKFCLENRYKSWWISQKEQGLNSAHVSLGIFISIVGGIPDKDDTEKYSEHASQCPTCQHYVEQWNIELMQKSIADKMERSP